VRIAWKRKALMDTTVQKLLECRGVGFFYPGTDKPVLEDLSFDLREPGLHAFFGPSGVGKTSLAHLLTGQFHPASGTIRAAGFDSVLYTYNMERLPGWAAVGRHLERITPEHKASVRDELVKIFGLSGLLGQRFAQLSLGQQNRVNLVRYLVQSFDLLIMDESLANVDEKTRGRILLAIKELFPRAFFIYISHNVVEVARYCRKIWVLRGVHTRPQAVVVEGQDQRSQSAPDLQAYQRTMLEIMNAA
jgi:ABC-type multidrug transport system ATPase subunit